MRLEQLNLRNFRCFAEARLELHPRLNWIVGKNASGKTSLLEALFFLGHGKSFRTNRPDRLIRAGAEGFEVVARGQIEGRGTVLGVARKPSGTEARLAGEAVRSMADVARTLPVVVLDSDMNRLIEAGPGERRRWLDWGVFHVEQGFHAKWRAYQQALRQRNGALRANATERALAPWTHAVVAAGETLSHLRRRHFEAILPLLLEYAELALPDVTLTATYRQGWLQEETLGEALERQLRRDQETGSTRSGPHRADVLFSVDGLPAEERLSRGQQKMLAGALWLAQVSFFTSRTNREPLLLLDDLAAELDTHNLHRFLELLNRQKAQHLLTAVSDTDITRTGLTSGRVFHVEQGRVLS